MIKQKSLVAGSKLPLINYCTILFFISHSSKTSTRNAPIAFPVRYITINGITSKQVCVSLKVPPTPL